MCPEEGASLASVPETGYAGAMSRIPERPRLATVADLMAIPEEHRFHEIIDRELVEKASPSFEHGGAQRKLSACIDPYDRSKPGGRHPGGWWFATEVEVAFGPHQIYRPDVAGWRRDRPFVHGIFVWPARLA